MREGSPLNISSVFIERPIFATVLAILIVVAGLLAIPSLPISEYPEIVPPTVVVSGQVPGRLAQDHCRDRDHAA